MDWKRFIPPVWYSQWLAGVSLLLIGSALLGEQAVQGNETAGATLLCIWGMVWTTIAAIGHRRKNSGGG